MRIRRGLLFWGLFLIALGAIPLLVRAGALDAARLTDVWRLWPLALILLGLAVLAGRHRAGLAGIAIAAIGSGALLGSVFVSGPQWIGDVSGCVPSDEALEPSSSRGALAGPTDVVIEVDCGRADVVAGPGPDWRAEVRSAGAPPVIAAGAGTLELRGPSGDGRHRSEWDIVLPDQETRSIELRADAATSTLDLTGMTLGSLSVDMDAGDLVIDVGRGVLDRLDVRLDAGRARITFGSSGATAGELSVNAAALELCVPLEVGLDLRVEEELTFAHDLESEGLAQEGERWTRRATGDAPTIDLRIEGNAASLTLDPEEGCG